MSISFEKTLALLLSFSTSYLCAQTPPLQLVPLESNPILQEYTARMQAQGHILHSRSPQVCPNQTLSLPFFDDFARVDSFYPKCSHWQDNQVFINQTMAYDPPTIGTATFDGLDYVGHPYNQQASLSIPSPADTLTSQLIDLSGRTAANNIYLSFFYQPQGLCDRPESSDSLILEFKTSSGDWMFVRNYPGVAATVSTLDLIPFQQDFIHIDDTSFFHSGFQFRFRNLATVTGNNDHWHLDYVYVDANRNAIPPITYPDVAFTQTTVSPLKYYRAMPWTHFDNTHWNDTMAIYTRNLSAISGTLDRLYTVYDTSSLNPNPECLNTPIPALTYSPSPSSQDTTAGTFLNPFNNLTLTDSTVLYSTYTILNPTDFQNNPLFAENDTVHRYTRLSNYFAYDDGTAEARIIAQGIGTKIAVEFKTTIQDTLRGIYFHLPYFTNRNAELDYINVKVWIGTLSNEVFSRDIYRLHYVEGFNGLYYVHLADFSDSLTPVALPANTSFFVGWQQASTIPVPVGYDRSNDSRSKINYYANGVWSNFDIFGSIMIRPLVSMDTTYSIIPVEKVEKTSTYTWTIFPNPAQNTLQILWNHEQKPASWIVCNTLGQQVLQSYFTQQLDITHLPTGVYTIQAYNEQGQRLDTKLFVKNNQ